jgi:hypothetical protein
MGLTFTNNTLPQFFKQLKLVSRVCYVVASSQRTILPTIDVQARTSRRDDCLLPNDRPRICRGIRTWKRGERAVYRSPAASTEYIQILCIIFVVLEYLAYTWYCLSYIPYARTAVKNMVGMS